MNCKIQWKWLIITLKTEIYIQRLSFFPFFSVKMEVNVRAENEKGFFYVKIIKGSPVQEVIGILRCTL